MEILPHYRQHFIKGDIIIGEWGIFGMEIFLRYSQFFVKGDFIIGGVECILEHLPCIVPQSSLGLLCICIICEYQINTCLLYHVLMMPAPDLVA